MAIRTDISVDWEASPRIITLASPATELSIQDLVDTCRFLESNILNMDDPSLIAAAGKEPLGGGTYVGITATLQNALLAFEARPGPTFELCKLFGGNLVAIDVNGDAVPAPIQPTAYVQILLAAASSSTLLEPQQSTFDSIVEGVWDLATAGHTTPGTFGASVVAAGAGGVDPQVIADAVWDADVIDHDNTGSFGELVVDSKVAIDNIDTDLAAAKVVIDSTKTVVDQIKSSTDSIVASETTLISLVQTLLKYSKNRTRIDKVAKTLTIYDDDTLTPIKVFDLKDSSGNPSITEIIERLPQ